MTKDKHIEEMRNDLCEADQEFGKFCRGRHCQECEYYFARTDCKNQILAEKLVEKGYRKASDVAREIFEELEKYLVTGSTMYGQAIHSIGVGTFARLKKKYIGKDTNVTTNTEGEG